MNNNRPLLPSLALPSSGDATASSSTPLARRRPNITLACDRCRARKSACDGTRPSCSRCIRQEVQCVYRDSKKTESGRMQRRLTNHEELVRHLRHLPEHDSIDLLRRLRAARDPAKFFASMQGAAHGIHRPSDLAAARGAGPPVKTNTEFELMICHSAAYLKINPVSSAFLENLVRLPFSPSQSPSRSNTSLIFGGSSVNEKRLDETKLKLSPTPPSALPRGNYCDERLHRLNVERWSCVPVANEFAAAVLSNYLENDHLIAGFIDADILLDDLDASSPHLYTPFLLSSLMFLACQSYIPVNIHAAALGLCFSEEAEMLYAGEVSVDAVPTVAGLLILSNASTIQGKGILGKELLSCALRMAERLGLFGVPPEDPAVLALSSKPALWLRAASHTAWGAFNYMALFNGFHTREAIRFPPTLPMPGAPALHSSPSLVTPTESLQHSRFISALFHIRCQLWAISQEIASVYKYQTDIPVAKRVPLAFAESKYRKMLDCMDQVNGDVVQRESSPTNGVILYINFHVLVLNVFHPFIEDSESSGRSLPTFKTPTDPKAIYAASVDQLKQLVLWCHLRYGKRITIFYNAAALVLVSALLRDDIQLGMEERLYFLLVIRCCADLEIAYPIFVDLAQAFLYKAVQRKILSVTESSTLLNCVQQRGSHHKTTSKAVLDCFTNATLSRNVPDTGTSHAMALLFEELSMFETYTTWDTPS